MYRLSKALAIGGDSIDLVGSLVDDLGDTVQFKKVHLVHFRNASSGSSNVTFNPTFPILGTSAQTIVLQPLGYATFTDESGVAITASSADKINITGTAGLDYDVIIAGLKL
jgi:hypothetical protein